MEQLYRIATGFTLDLIEGAVNNTFSDRLFAVQHKAVNELADYNVAKLSVGYDLAFFSSVASRHEPFLFLFGPFRTVFRAPLTTITYTLGIERSPDNVVPDAGQILNAPTADHNN
jgi:hypothetical protein